MDDVRTDFRDRI